MEHFIAEVVAEKPTAMDKARLAKVKVPLLELMGREGATMAIVTAAAIQRESTSALRYGFAGLEEMLSFVGMSGEIPEEVRKVGIELVAVRNILVHRGGVVDASALLHCPWLSAKGGEAFRVTHARFEMYLQAAFWYTMNLTYRLKVSQGDTRKEQYERILGATLADLRRRFSQPRKPLNHRGAPCSQNLNSFAPD